MPEPGSVSRNELAEQLWALKTQENIQPRVHLKSKMDHETILQLEFQAIHNVED